MHVLGIDVGYRAYIGAGPGNCRMGELEPIRGAPTTINVPDSGR